MGNFLDILIFLMLVNIIYKILVLKFSADKLQKDAIVEGDENIDIEHLAIDKINNQYYAYLNNVFIAQSCSIERVIAKLINDYPKRYFVVNTNKSELSTEDKITLVSVINAHLAA